MRKFRLLQALGQGAPSLLQHKRIPLQSVSVGLQCRRVVSRPLGICCYPHPIWRLAVCAHASHSPCCHCCREATLALRASSRAVVCRCPGVWRGGSRRREGAGQVFFAAKGFKNAKSIYSMSPSRIFVCHMSLRVWVRVRVRVRVGLLPASTTGGRAFSAEGGTEGGAGGAGRPRLAACVATPDSPGYASVRWFYIPLKFAFRHVVASPSA